MPKAEKYSAVDLFCGCGGLTKGMHRAGFHSKIAIDNNQYACDTYKLNFPNAEVIHGDIRSTNLEDIRRTLGDTAPHLLAGCPPCQGFSSLRRLNQKQSVRDPRNSLVLEFLRFVIELEPYTIMMENVPGLINYYQFRKVVSELRKLKYNPVFKIVNVKDYGVPQSRERLILMGSRLGEIQIHGGIKKHVTVRERIGHLPRPNLSKDPMQKIVMNHIPRIKKMISLVPKNGGGRLDLPEEYILECHKKEGVGFNDIYGRLRWDDHSTTITGGCLNPSKGRFLHPRQNRVITPREASMLQSFPENYRFLEGIPKDALGLLIGNALPPTFSYYQSRTIKAHLDEHLG